MEATRSKLDAFEHLKKMADFYNVNKDLFQTGYFLPQLDLNVAYDDSNRIFYGNKLAAEKVSTTLLPLLHIKTAIFF